jgi:hypothetical protein
MSPPWTVGAVTLAHVGPQAYGGLPASLRDALARVFWGEPVMTAFPGDRAWQAGTSVLTDIAWWMACVPRVPVPVIAGGLLAFLPEATAIITAMPVPAAAVAREVPPCPAPRGRLSFRLSAAGWPQCRHGPLRLVPAGTSARTGRPYQAFWGCPAWPAGRCDTRGWDLPPARIPSGG